MNLIGVSQRVEYAIKYPETRDALDQRWITFLDECNFTPLLLPNNKKVAQKLIESFEIKGILLTGGNNLIKYGGESKERDEVEIFLLNYAIDKKIPLMGVCRGMQLIQDSYGIKLVKVTGHVTDNLVITINGIEKNVNSYHQYGTYETNINLETWAIAEDGVIKAIKNNEAGIKAIMWHPERQNPFNDEDLKLFKDFYKGA
jgi:putative glutamine amidotransferase